MGTGPGFNQIKYLPGQLTSDAAIHAPIRLIFKIFIILSGCLASKFAQAQTPAQIITELKAINNKVIQAPCNSGKGMLISNKAMNIFLSNKISSYLSDNEDLSLYKNYVIADAGRAAVSVNHNFHEPVDSDDYVRSFVVVSGNVTVANAYLLKVQNVPAVNQLGFTLQKTWMEKPATRYNGCNIQKLEVDARRAEILQRLAAEISRKATGFEEQVNTITATDVPRQFLQDPKEALRKEFYTSLRTESLMKFSEEQADMLISTNNYTLITDSWTTVGIYVPIIRQQFRISSNINNEPVNKYNYPLKLILNHSWFGDSPKYGRVYMRLGAQAFLNNTAQSGAMLITDVTGADDQNANNAAAPAQGMYYTGGYRNFVTTVASGKLVYFPPDSHVGVSFKLEKNFGSYHALNSTLGIPIVLIDKKGVPAINFEMQLLFTDVNNSTYNQFNQNRTTVGLTVGIPFSKIVY